MPKGQSHIGAHLFLLADNKVREEALLELLGLLWAWPVAVWAGGRAVVAWAVALTLPANATGIPHSSCGTPQLASCRPALW